MFPGRNMKAYRDAVAAATPPLLPVLPVYLKDIYFLNDGNPKRAYGKLLNVEKLRLIGDTVRQLVAFTRPTFDTQGWQTLSAREVKYIREPDVISTVVLLAKHSKRNEPPLPKAKS